MPTALKPQDLGLSGYPSVENDSSDQLRPFSRSPHPYHRRKFELVSSTERSSQATGVGDERSFSSPTLTSFNDDAKAKHETYFGNGRRVWREGYKSPSDSGTEADDEGNSFLKRLPAPPQRLRKGLKDARGLVIETTPSPLLTPSYLDTDQWRSSLENINERQGTAQSRQDADEETRKAREKFTRRRKAELIRRTSEVLVVGTIGCIVWRGVGVSLDARLRRKELLGHCVVVLGLYLLYPLRLLLNMSNIPAAPGSYIRPHIRVPSAFDPAPLLYPIFLPVYIALVLVDTDQSVLLPNLILSLSSIPSQLIPVLDHTHGNSVVHWTLATIPLLLSKDFLVTSRAGPHKPHSLKAASSRNFDPELLMLLYPLHQALLSTLQYLTTTSLLPTELQLLSTCLINILLNSTSPEGIILKALLWLGGLSMFVLCKDVLNWEVALARIPNWRFRRTAHAVRIRNAFLEALNDTIGKKLSGAGFLGETLSSDSDAVEDGPLSTGRGRIVRSLVPEIRDLGRTKSMNTKTEPRSVVDACKTFPFLGSSDDSKLQNGQYTHMRRHTLSTFDGSLSSPRLSTSRSRRRHKRSMSSSAHFFLSLTSAQATVRKWLYAMYVYAAVILVISIGIRMYVSRQALAGTEPVGWALGYLLGDIQTFRFWVVSSNLERWISLPSRPENNASQSCHLGWVEHLRRDTFGEANTRLLICGYCLVVLTVGMAVVLRLSSVVEVDTRRKVFHGMMVAMFLPATFIDPAFASLALALILALFLLLDLFRASQLPPLSKPLTYFLAPYVDGRDHRGPVIVSHIFLLIGCAIPLWLSLAGIERTGQAPWQGWEVARREVSMVSGVVCVGMGDAAASLIGRRFGRRKWLWSGGKSLEGSFAFAAAVTLGLVLAKAWLRVGGWSGNDNDQWFVTLAKSVMAASGASLTEAILTGGNDNVVVPVVLWLLVKGLRI
ncbi:MAG: hypothetical protein M1830_004410 [Pleopsidium flavum]|nr:MAG: hypothetical protein M1830_004410 [Pleopsidium flavum]